MHANMYLPIRKQLQTCMADELVHAYGMYMYIHHNPRVRLLVYTIFKLVNINLHTTFKLVNLYTTFYMNSIHLLMLFTSYTL